MNSKKESSDCVQELDLRVGENYTQKKFGLCYYVLSINYQVRHQFAVRNKKLDNVLLYKTFILFYVFHYLTKFVC